MLDHTRLFLAEMGEIGPSKDKTALVFGDNVSHDMTIDVKGKSFALLKKHFRAYVHGFHGAKELRTQLMNSSSYQEILDLTQAWTKDNPELAQSAPNEEYIV